MGRSGQQKKSSDDHARLQPRVVHVSEATIRKRWRRLPSASHSAARELILSAKKQSRPRRRKSGIDLATEDIVQEVVNNLTDKLTRIPYPPSTDEHHFDHEANLHRISKIEEQLNSNMHSMTLLRTQLTKEEELLKQDEAEVNYLEQSLKSNDILRRQQNKTLHPLARDLLADHSDLDPLIPHKHEMIDSEPSLLTLFQDEDMLPTLGQLQSHLDSMHNNIHNIKEVTQAVGVASLNLTSLSYTQHGDERYERGRTRRTNPNQT